MASHPDAFTGANGAQFDNPMWHALNGIHRHLAEGKGHVRWYPQDIAPFFAVPTTDIVIEPAQLARAGHVPSAYFVGVLPRGLPDGWHLGPAVNVLQLLYQSTAVPQRIDEGDRLLAQSDNPSMQALAKIAFPDFFRSRTRELGTYVGHFETGQLVSMAGERLALEGFREISAVCTHPKHVGRGHAQRLTRVLLDQHRQLGLRSFLHVSEGNLRARGLYESMGFVVRATLLMRRLEQIPALALEGKRQA
jgi:ribosomal protein S18 acetylase RimI-like enzyme